jgi:hypothetical protein
VPADPLRKNPEFHGKFRNEKYSSENEYGPMAGVKPRII